MPDLERHLDPNNAGLAALKNAMRSFERWLTFCCIVMLLVQLATMLVIMWRI